MELRRSQYADLSLFLRIVQFRSFRRAADHLDVTVSALSHRMKALETRLGVRLLNRTSRSVSPTAAGEALARKVAAGLEADRRWAGRGPGSGEQQRRQRAHQRAAGRGAAASFARTAAICGEVSTRGNRSGGGRSFCRRNVGRVRRRSAIQRLHTRRHGRGAFDGTAWLGGGRLARLFRARRSANYAGRYASAPVHSRSHRTRADLPLGVRPGRGSPRGRCAGPVDVGIDRSGRLRRDRRGWHRLLPRSACAPAPVDRAAATRSPEWMSMGPPLAMYYPAAANCPSALPLSSKPSGRSIPR